MSLFSRLKSLLDPAQSRKVGNPPTVYTPPSSVPKVVRKPVAKKTAPAKPVIQNAVEQPVVLLQNQIETIAPGIVCDEFDGSHSQITTLPDDFVARRRLILSHCKRLTQLPDGLSVPSVDLSNCTALTQLPAGMQVAFLTLKGSDQITTLPEDFKISGGILDLSGCTALNRLPDNMGEVAGLNLNGCANLTALPEGLKITSWIDISGTKITTLPPAYMGLGFRNGRDVITVEDALAA